MKLSEAIREGSKGMEQGYGGYFPKVGACCALGAAYHAIWPEIDARLIDDEYDWDLVFDQLNINFPQLHDYTSEEGHHLRNLVVNWNDEQKLTFEEIATKLEERGL